MTSLTQKATEPLGVKPRDAERSKNFFALGLVSWLYSRPTEPTLEWIESKFKDELVTAQQPRRVHRRLQLRRDHRAVRPSASRSSRRRLPAGEYTNITGNIALAWGLVAAGQLAKLPVFLGSYPITPASDILHELSKHKHFGVRTVQAEDEIAAAGMALGAAFAGHLGVTTTSGPGVALKSETISLAVSLELPLLIIDIQRGGPSTGLPTKTEAADLNIAMYGRHGEAPLPIVAAYSPANCFDAAIEAARIALKYRTPVILLSDGYLANGSEPWLLPDVDSLPDISVPFATEMNHTDDDGTTEFWPYLRDPDTLARPWAIPGTPGLMHRVGGLEKEDGTRQHQLHAGEPRTHGAPARRQDRRHRQRHPARRDRRRRRRRRLRARLGFDLGGDRRRRAAHPPRRARRWPGSTSPTSTRCRRNLGELLQRFPQGARARAQPRPAVPHRARRVPGRRQVGHQGAGPAVHRRANSKTQSKEALQ